MSHSYTPGTYRVTCYGSYVGKSAGKGTPEIRIAFYCEEFGLIYAYRYLAGGAVQYVKKELLALGWDADARKWKLSEIHQVDTPLGLEEDPVTASALRGVECSIVVDEETSEYEGRTRKKLFVRFINSLGGKPRNDLPEQEQAAFLADLQKRLLTGESPARPATETTKPIRQAKPGQPKPPPAAQPKTAPAAVAAPANGDTEAVPPAGVRSIPMKQPKPTAQEAGAAVAAAAQVTRDEAKNRPAPEPAADDADADFGDIPF